MKKYLFILLPVFLLLGCESREEKAIKLIKEDMFKTLYNFESYEPIETKIDSAYTSIYTDSVIRSYAYIAIISRDDAEDNFEKLKEDRNTMDIWENSYSSLGESKYNEASEDFYNCYDNMERGFAIMHKYMDSIRIKSANFHPQFYGWKVIHKFRCKTKGGYFDLGNYVYVFDKDMNGIIYKEDIDDKNGIHDVIDEAINAKK